MVIIGRWEDEREGGKEKWQGGKDGLGGLELWSLRELPGDGLQTKRDANKAEVRGEVRRQKGVNAQFREKQMVEVTR